MVKENKGKTDNRNRTYQIEQKARREKWDKRDKVKKKHKVKLMKSFKEADGEEEVIEKPILVQKKKSPLAIAKSKEDKQVKFTGIK